MSSATFAADLTDTGASSAFTSDDPVVKSALKMLDAGNFSRAEQFIATTQPSGDPSVTKSREEVLDLIKRMRNEFRLDEEGLLAKIQKRIPDATARDITRWREAGELQYRIIDDKLLYFGREPSNLFIFSADAKKRSPEKKSSGKSDWTLEDHLKQIVGEAESSGKTEVAPVQHRVEYAITVPPSSLKPGALVRIWLPYPQEYRQQKNVKLISATPENPQIAPPAIDGNPVQHAQRTAYFEQRVIDPAKPIKASITFEYTIYAYYPKLDEKLVEPLPADWNGAYLGERLPHIKFAPAIVEQTKQIVGDETNPLTKARKIFHWVSANIPWNAEQEYCVIPSLSEWGFTRRRGDCGVQGTVFVTMCRIAGIPARWQSGWETKPSSWTMHDWSEIYIAPWGWLPADASYGVQKSDDEKIADFYLGHIDSHRMIVNLDYGRQLEPPKESLRSEPADFQRGEVEIDGKNLYFDQWDYNIRVWCDGKEI
jgi:transglutaminase-like putative cysteine protease